MGGKKQRRRGLIVAIVAAAVVAVGVVVVLRNSRAAASLAGFYKGNGRLEATEIEIASKYAGRVADVLVREGDRVTAGQVLAHMDARDLDAQLAEAKANVASAVSAKATARASVVQAQGALRAADAQLALEQATEANAKRNLERTKALVGAGSATQQQLDNDQTSFDTAHGHVDAASANVDSAKADLEVAMSRVTQAEAEIEAAQATVDRIAVDRGDSSLKAPRSGRIEHQLAQPGEVVGAGGPVLEMIDLSDVYMTIFLPERITGRLAIGEPARILLDSTPGHPIPATVSYVASEAQFTPKTVETADEREQLVFEVRLSVKQGVLEKFGAYAKVGLPGVGYVRIDPSAAWPESLEVGPLPAATRP